jgi:hypothetical protein
MKKIDLSQMTEDQLCDMHCDLMDEIAGTTVGIVNAQRKVSKLVKLINKLDLALEAIESQKLGQENKLN